MTAFCNKNHSAHIQANDTKGKQKYHPTLGFGIGDTYMSYLLRFVMSKLHTKGCCL